MKFVTVNEISRTRDILQVFKGYNHNLRISDGEFFDTKNLSSDLYPVLSQRGKRGTVKAITKPNGLHATDRLVYVDGQDLWYNNVKVVEGELTDSPKQLVTMGNYIVIMPDKKVYNIGTGQLESMEATYETISDTTYTLCTVDGTAYVYTTGSTAPVEVENGDFWLDTSVTPNVLKVYSATTSSWSIVPTTYVKIAATGINALFSQNDTVTISGSSDAQFNADMVIQAIGTGYIVVVGLIDEVFTQETAITLQRKVPDMDFICENDNRIWGCSSANHEIYACKLGDPKNWYSYTGIASDSYAVTVGSHGNFTGCISHLGYVLFFKEDKIIKIYGTMPSNYALSSVDCRGVQGGSEKSLVIVNETLYYKSEYGVMAYGGSLPESISSVFGQEHYTDAVAGKLNNKYYISMKDVTNTWHLFVYDVKSGIWIREDNTQVKYFSYLDNELFFVDSANNLRTILGSSGTKETSIEWYAITGDIGLSLPDNKYITGIRVRVEMEEGSEFSFSVQYDNETSWDLKKTITTEVTKSFEIPMIPKRCDRMRLKFSGTGNVRIYSVSKYIENGSGM